MSLNRLKISLVVLGAAISLNLQAQTVQLLSLKEAQLIAKSAQSVAEKLKKNVTVAIVGIGGETVLIYRGDGVGPHNTEAARRKAYTSLSTKTDTLTLARKAKADPDSSNLAHLPELLLLGGGHPILRDSQVIGAIGIAGGGGALNDHKIAQEAVHNK